MGLRTVGSHRFLAEKRVEERKKLGGETKSVPDTRNLQQR